MKQSKNQLKQSRGFFVLLIWLLFGMSVVPFQTTVYAKKQLTKTVRIGETVQLQKNADNYKSSDTTIASVNENGRVTGKKIGTTTIAIKNNNKFQKVSVNVVANKRKKSIRVAADEIVVLSQEIVKESPSSVYSTYGGQEWDESHNSYVGKIVVQNQSKEDASRIEIVGKLNGEQVVFKNKTLGSGQTITLFSDKSTASADATLELLSKSVFTNKMESKYYFQKNKTALYYATEDETAPVFSGWIGKNSYNGSIPYRVVYSDKVKSFDFTKYVKATDDRDGEVKVTVDTSKVNFQKTGTYTVTYIAKDKAGNEARANTKIGVRVPSTLEEICDSVLKEITNSSMSDTAKARAIYNYIKQHMSYTGDSDKSSWEKEAIRGLRFGYGDCFTYYAVSRALLTRAGIPNIEVRRVKADDRGHARHWWNMVYVQGGWYHYDTCPRSLGGRFCLVTDKQLTSYSNSHKHSHIWDYKGKPKSATKVLSSIY